MGKRGTDILIGCLVMFVAASFAHAQVEIWEYYHDGPATGSDLVLGADNNVYAAGYIEDVNGQDFAVISVDDTGIERWVVTLNGSANGDDIAKSIVYGGDGNIYAAGLIEDAVTGKDLVVISFNTSGDTNWVYTYDGPSSGGDGAQAVVYGNDGYIYAAGNSSGTGTANDLIIVKLSTSGNEEWVYRYDGSNSAADVLYDIVYGTDGNLYAGGYLTETGQQKNFAVISTDTDGNYRWHYTHNGTAGSSQDQVRAITYGSDGYVYATGWSKNTMSDYTITKLDTDGNEQWIYYTDTTGEDKMFDIVYGSDNNIYAAGFMKGTWDDFAVVSHDTSGTRRWKRRINGSSGFTVPNDRANAVIYGGDGNIYAVGYLQNETTKQDLVVACYDNTGTKIWTYEKNMPVNGNDQGKKIIWGTDDNLYVVGRLAGGNGRFGILCIDPTAYPDIWVSPSSFYVQLYEGETTDRPLRLVNVGTGDMDWTISEKIGSNWLSVDDTTGNTAPGDTASLTVTFDGTVVPPAHYYDTLVVTINNPYNPETEVSVHLWVKELGIEDYPFDMIEDKCQVISSFFTKQISLSFTKPSETACEIGIYNVLGMRVYHKSIPSTPSLVNLDDEKIAKLSNGIYFLSVSRTEKTYPVKKLIKY